MGAMGLFDGTSSLYDHDRDEDLNNWLSFDVRHDRVIFMLGDVRRRTRPQIVEVVNPAIVRLMQVIVSMLRFQARHQRQMTPAPKPPRTEDPQRNDLPLGTCPRCGGQGEYQWGESFWKPCRPCNGTGRIDRGEQPDDEE